MAAHWFMILGHTPMLVLTLLLLLLFEGVLVFGDIVPKQLLSCPTLINRDDLCSANRSCTAARLRESIVL